RGGHACSRRLGPVAALILCVRIGPAFSLRRRGCASAAAVAFLPSQVAADWPWLAPAIAAVVAASVLVALRRSAALVVLAGALMAVSGFTAARARLLLDVTRGLEGGWPEIDLTTDGIPERLPEYVELRGYFRDAWTL